MKAENRNIANSLALELFKNTQQDNLEYVYRGKFNTDITDNILSLAEESLKLSEKKLSIKKRVYFVMVEGLQNITRHQEISGANFPVKPGLFVLQRKEHSYYITTGNLIEKRNIPILRKQIERVNNLSKEELNEFYKTHLAEGGFSGKGGAGLGLIEIARKSKGTLSYDFRKIQGKYYYFYLLTEIPFDKETKILKETTKDSLNSIKDLHDILNKEQIILNYSGIFNQDNLVNLLGIIEKQMKGTAITRIKTFNVMVEMLQNLVQHSDLYKYNQIIGKHGIFYITESTDKFELTTGNYIKQKKVEKLDNFLSYINNLSSSELNKLYDKQLLEFDDSDEDNLTGIGFIDMRLKSKSILKYKFDNVDSEFSFFTITLLIEKKLNYLEKFYKEGNKDRPEILFDPKSNIFSIKGSSIPEDAAFYYGDAIDWIKKYIKSPNAKSIFKFDFKYINTNSTHQIIQMLNILNKIAFTSDIIIKWCYLKEDDDMYDLGLRLMKLHDLDFNFTESKNKFIS